MAIGTTIPPRATTSGSASRRRSRSSPRSNSRRASRPATRKKNAISPEFTQPCQLSARPVVPDLITSTVCHVAAYPDGSMLAQASAASVAASRTAALPVSVRANCRSGVSSLRAHTVRGENRAAEASGSVTPGFSRAPPSLTTSEQAGERERYVTRHRRPRWLVNLGACGAAAPAGRGLVVQEDRVDAALPHFPVRGSRRAAGAHAVLAR